MVIYFKVDQNILLHYGHTHLKFHKKRSYTTEEKYIFRIICE